MELPTLGVNCMICNRNDYLPFKCSYCDKIVCIDHRTNHGTGCPINSTTFECQANSKSESLKKACDFCNKITLKLELVECSQCHNSHCLYHRHQVQHKCKQLEKDQLLMKQEAEEKAIRQQQALNKLKELGSCGSVGTTFNVSKNPIDPKKQELARKIRLMKIKQNARGPPNILQEDKIYFEIKFKHEPKSSLSSATKDNNSIRIYTTPKHTVGRMIDWSADELDLPNKNHLNDADQLVFKKQLHHDPSNPLKLDTHKLFGELLEDKRLYNGDEIILTYEVS